MQILHRFWEGSGAAWSNSNRFASPASPDVWLMRAELMFAELTVLVLAELNDFPVSDIIEYMPYCKSPLLHVLFSNLT